MTPGAHQCSATSREGAARVSADWWRTRRPLMAVWAKTEPCLVHSARWSLAKSGPGVARSASSDHGDSTVPDREPTACARRWCVISMMFRATSASVAQQVSDSLGSDPCPALLRNLLWETYAVSVPVPASTMFGCPELWPIIW